MAEDLKKLETLVQQPIKTGCAIPSEKKTVIYYKRCIIPLSEILMKKNKE